jgi:integrase
VNGGPSAAGNLLVALRGVIQFAISVGLRGDDPTTGLHRPKATRRGGFYSWDEQDIEKFEATFPIGTRERLALVLLLETAQRRGDVIRMGWQHVRNGVITVRQAKTGRALQIPMSPTLAAALQATPSNNLPFLVTLRGTPFNATAFSDWFKRAVRAAGLPADASVHGLRKAAARRLAEAGCSANIIAAQ